MSILRRRGCCCNSENPLNCKCAPDEYGTPAPFDATAIGEVIMTFSGASVPSQVTTPDYRTTILDLMGNPGLVPGNANKTNKVYAATNRTRFDVFGEMPTQILGWCSHPNSSLQNGCIGRNPHRTMHIINKRAGSPSGPALPYLSFISCAFPQSFYSIDRRRSYRGNEIPFATQGDAWAYILPYADGIQIAQYDVFYEAQIQHGSFGGDPNLVSFALLGIVDGGWLTSDLYTDPTNIWINCEYQSTRMNYAFVAWRGELELEPGESFPCSRSEWVFNSVGNVGDQNWNTVGNPYNLPSANCVQIGSGGTMTLTSANCRPWLGDAPETYRVNFMMGPPNYINGTGNPMTVQTTGMETTTIDLVRYCHGTVSSAGEIIGNWYGESEHYKASMYAIDDKSAGSGSIAMLKIERKESFPDDAAGSFHCVFFAQITSDERSPPEHDETTPRYILDQTGFSHFRWIGCGNQFNNPLADNRTIQQFAYRLISVTKEDTQPYVCPPMRCYVGCPPILKVTYKPTAGSETALDSIQVMLPETATPEGHIATLVYPNTTYENNGICRWDNESEVASEPIVSIQYLNVSEDAVKRTVTPPRFELSLIRGCPSCRYVVSHNLEPDSNCVPLGEWIIDNVYCSYCQSCADAPCNTCVDCECAPSSMEVSVYAYDPETETNESVSVIVTRTSTDPCIYSGTNGAGWAASVQLRSSHPDDPGQVYDPPIYFLRLRAPDSEIAIEGSRACVAPGMLGAYSVITNNFSGNPTEVYTQ